MNPPSLEKYAPLVLTNGVLVLDAILIQARSGRADIHELAVPAKAIADELGAPQIANVVMLGALLAATRVVTLDTMDNVIAHHLSERHRNKLEANRSALRRGAECVMEHVAIQ
jgi:2-oxoglutarate ferredoxin oxidoreductase subunit gamma